MIQNKITHAADLIRQGNKTALEEALWEMMQNCKFPEVRSGGSLLARETVHMLMELYITVRANAIALRRDDVLYCYAREHETYSADEWDEYAESIYLVASHLLIIAIDGFEAI